MSALVIMLAFLLFTLFLYTATLWLAGKLLRFNAPTLRRAFSVILLLFLAGGCLAIPQLFLSANGRLAYAFLAFPLQVLLGWYLIKKIHRTTTGRAWAGNGIFLATELFALLIAFLIIRPFLVEAYSLSSNSMSPEIHGPYRVAVARCPKCGGELLVDATEYPRGFPPQIRGAICANCLHAAELPNTSPAGPIIPSDRIFVSKFLAPRRWDIIAHRTKTGDVFLKRLVALPGETIAIDQQGRISINGALIGPPPDQPALTFPWPERFEQMPEHVLAQAAPLQLGPDDYFVLGDNATHSYDSRSYGPIHSADIIGVASMIYWPLNRIRTIR